MDLRSEWRAAPRGSEYDVHLMFDGLPLTQNRSPAFAPSLDPDEVESMRVLTASFPANTDANLAALSSNNRKNPAVRGSWRFGLDGGSFSSLGGSGIFRMYAKEPVLVWRPGISHDRYLDPPVLQDFYESGQRKWIFCLIRTDFRTRPLAAERFPQRSALSRS